jgi:hypothetical protein
MYAPSTIDANPLRWLIAVAALLVAWPIHAAELADTLTRTCDDLLQLAVRRPYGFGWPADGPSPVGGISVDPTTTASAAFVLYWAGDALDKPAYKSAAIQAARGLAAAQLASGAVPPRIVFFQSKSGGFEHPALVADRRATCAAEGLFLTILDDAGDTDPRLHGSAMWALTWLLHQQPTNGSWPQADPPATQPKDAIRLIRLDNGDWRNCTMTMLLAGDVLSNIQARLSVQHSNDFLLRLRIGDVSQVGKPLWATAYGMDTFPSARLADLPPGIDVLASRMAMQTLLATDLLIDEPTTRALDQAGKNTVAQAFTDAAATLAKLPRYDGQWMRVYDYDVDATKPPLPPLDPAVEAAPLVLQASRHTGDWGITAILQTASVLKSEGRKGLIAQLSTEMNLHQRFAATICGVEDEPLAVKFDPPDSIRLTGDSTVQQRILFAWETLRQLRQISR